MTERESFYFNRFVEDIEDNVAAEVRRSDVVREFLLGTAIKWAKNMVEFEKAEAVNHKLHAQLQALKAPDYDAIYSVAVPRVLLENKEYEELSISAKVLYAVLKELQLRAYGQGWNSMGVLHCVPIKEAKVAKRMQLSDKQIMELIDELLEYELVSSVKKDSFNPFSVRVEEIPKDKKTINKIKRLR